MSTLTLKRLREAGICDKQRQLFEALFGEQAEVTPAACMMVAPLFSWSQAAGKLLDDDHLRRFVIERDRLSQQYLSTNPRDPAAYVRSAAQLFGTLYVEQSNV